MQAPCSAGARGDSHGCSRAGRLRLRTDGAVEIMPPAEALALRRELEQLKAEGYYSVWTRWFLTPRTV